MPESTNSVAVPKAGGVRNEVDTVFSLARRASMLDRGAPRKVAAWQGPLRQSSQLVRPPSHPPSQGRHAYDSLPVTASGNRNWPYLGNSKRPLILCGGLNFRLYDSADALHESVSGYTNHWVPTPVAARRHQSC